MKMIKKLPFHPVFYPHIRHILEVLDVVGDNSQSSTEGMAGNNHIKLVNTFAFPFKSIFDLAVVFGSIARQFKDYDFLNKLISRRPKVWLSRSIFFISSAVISLPRGRA